MQLLGALHKLNGRIQNGLICRKNDKINQVFRVKTESYNEIEQFQLFYALQSAHTLCAIVQCMRDSYFPFLWHVLLLSFVLFCFGFFSVERNANAPTTHRD